MGKTTQIWKFSWNPEGYTLTEERIDIPTKELNSNISLKHTYFKSLNFLAYTITDAGNKKYFKCHTVKDDTTDLLFVDKDITLSTLCNSDVYSKLKIVSTKVAKLDFFYVDCTFLADVLNPDSFNQDLHQLADVEHKTLKLSDWLEADSLKVTSLVSETLRGSWGRINENKVKFDVPLEVSGVTLNETKLLFADSFEIGNTNTSIKYNTNKKYYQLFIEDKEYTLLKAPQLKEIPIYGIPVILSNDKAQLSFTEFLLLDPTIKGLKTGGINLDDNSLMVGNTFDLAKKEKDFHITINKDKFVDYDSETGDCYILKNLIKMNTKTKEVTINGMKLDENFFKQFTQMQRDIKTILDKLKIN